MIKKEVVLIVLFLVLINIASASNEILLKSRHFVSVEGISEATKAKIEAIPERAHVIIQLEKIPTIKERKELEERGIKLLSYISNRAWFASIPSNRGKEIVALPNIRGISEILPRDKNGENI